MRRVLIILWLAFAGLLLGSANPPPPKAAPKSDAEMERTIQQKFSKSKIAVDGFQVRVQNGVATLTGATNVAQRKGVATRLARSAGVKSVVNNIQVSAQGRQKASAPLRKANIRPGAGTN
jgi:osmotically-inducible protein OsmY